MRFCVRDIACWKQGQAWDDVSNIPMILRRRVSVLGKQALKNAWEMSGASEARIILSTQHADFERTLSIMESLAAQDNVSPADFSLSSHHALAGLLSIAQKNTRGHTALAAGSESFCFGLMEAAGVLAENPDEEVLLLHYDQPLPGPFYDYNNPPEHAIAVAVHLCRGDEILLSCVPNESDHSPSLSPVEDFLAFLSSSNTEASCAGERQIWHWQKHASI